MKFQKRGDGNATEKAPLDEKEAPKSQRKSEQSVIVYVTILFTVAFLLVLLSYFIQQRRNANTIDSINEEHSQATMQAQINIDKLQNYSLKLETEIDELEDDKKELEERIDTMSEVLDEIRVGLLEKNQEIAELTEQISAIDTYMKFREAYLTDDREELERLKESVEAIAEKLPDEYKEEATAMLNEING